MDSQETEWDCLKLSRQLCFPLYVCSKEITRRYKPYLDQIGLTYTQYITMLVLWEHPQNAVNVTELGKSLYLDSGTLTPLLKKLEAKGLITRHRDQSDERSVLVSVTQKGMGLREKAVSVPARMSACVDLTEDEVRQLLTLLQKVIHHVERS
jgi:DNA-binding MarR family transcriptional regulator